MPRHQTTPSTHGTTAIPGPETTTLESIGSLGTPDLHQDFGGCDAAKAPHVDGGWHGSYNRKVEKGGVLDHLNVKYKGSQWQIEGDSSRSVYGNGQIERFDSEEGVPVRRGSEQRAETCEARECGG
jgi:hypothetical protein